ncbi:conserved hypothetical protein [Talaromyces marneffei ATCC 18224]|uniref:Protein kinase domain-containing protein n=1 Tax=Talaromyces marneffei (strain ATCC 18224 / CBS 334.59 / QM 7333) TaxID=441960 RepID=B6QK90_TALMQ|nr:conserved hypothetical protein [Talaromyces marneffei ATCC 18224]
MKPRDPTEVPIAESSPDFMPQRKLLMVGMSAKTYHIGNIVRKELHVLPDDPRIIKQNIEACRTKADVYRILGPNRLVATCLSISPSMDFIDLKCYQNGNLKQYVYRNRAHITETDQKRWAPQMIESIAYIYSKDQWHVDRALNVRISYFNASGFDCQPSLGLEAKPAVGMENGSHCLPRDIEADSTVRSDLSALGSSLYELLASQSPYKRLSDKDIELLYRKEDIPCAKGLLLGDTIKGCWKEDFQ